MPAAVSTTCAHCQQRRGRRACPALQGNICTACCGQHRLQAIRCPADCVHLGGLAAVASAALATQSAFLAALPRLTRYLNAERPAFLKEGLLALKTTALGPWAEPMVVAHLCYGHRGAGGQRLLDRFLLDRGRSLPAEEVAALTALCDAGLRLCEVRALAGGALLFMNDLLTGEDLVVQEHAAEQPLRAGSLLCGWLLRLDGSLRSSGALLRVPETHREALLALLQAEREEARARRPETPEHQLLNESTGAILQLLQPTLGADR